MRDYRNVIKHTICSDDTEIDHSLAKTLCETPEMVARLSCASCGNTFPVTDFVWPEDGRPVNIKQQKLCYGQLNGFTPVD